MSPEVTPTLVDYSKVEITGAAETADEAIAIAMREAGYGNLSRPRDAVVRMVPAVEIGKWDNDCLGWRGDYPMWLVVMAAEGPTPRAYPGARDMSDVSGFYVTIRADSGQTHSWGTGGDLEVLRSRAAALPDYDLPVAYISPLPPISGGGYESGLELLEVLHATMTAWPAAEAACRREHWSGTQTPYPGLFRPTPTASG